LSLITYGFTVIHKQECSADKKGVGTHPVKTASSSF